MKRVAVMQPYFLPYIGYFQLVAAVDLFIVYDNIEYTKKGWINRNRLLRDGRDVTFTVPLKAAADTLHIRERELAAGFRRDKLLNVIAEAYRRAPQFDATWPLVERIVAFDAGNLFDFLHHAIARTCAHLAVTTEIRVSSTVDIDHGLRNQEKVLALCEAVGATAYVNAIGGRELYSREVFRARGIDLAFLQPRPFTYAQSGRPFVPWLSILDVMMYNPVAEVRSRIATGYDLV